MVWKRKHGGGGLQASTLAWVTGWGTRAIYQDKRLEWRGWVYFSNTHFKVLVGHWWTVFRRICGARAPERARLKITISQFSTHVRVIGIHSVRRGPAKPVDTKRIQRIRLGTSLLCSYLHIGYNDNQQAHIIFPGWGEGVCMTRLKTL